ncbi:hypothetical protein D3C71_1382950 [compost metagenome]
MQTQPGRSHRPKGGRNEHILRGRIGPDIGVMMGCKSPAVIHLPGRYSARFPHSLNMIEQRLMALSQAAVLRRPIIHLGVDVNRILTVPRRPEAVVPNTLQIGGQRTGPAAGYEQIAPVMEIQGDQIIILFTLRVPFQALIRRKPASFFPA